jgi:hypothetical protein
VLLSVKDPDEIERLAMSQSKNCGESWKPAEGKLPRGKAFPMRNFGSRSRR